MNPAKITDKIGLLRSEIKALQDELVYQKTLLKNARVTTAEGIIFNVAISYDCHRSKIDWKAIALLSNPSRATIVAHTSLTVHDRVYVNRKVAE